MNKLKGFLQSGIITIHDPVYMSGDTREGIVEDPYNPFRNWDVFTHGLGGEDANMAFPGTFNEASYGRGCCIQTGRLSGTYEIEKVTDDEGKLSQLIIKFKD